MLHAIFILLIRMAAGFQDVIEAQDISLNIHIRVRDRVAHTCLSCEVHDNSGVIVCKNLIDERTICNRTLDESPSGLGVLCRFLLDLGESPLLDGHIVVVVDIVDADDVTRRLCFK